MNTYKSAQSQKEITWQDGVEFLTFFLIPLFGTLFWNWTVVSVMFFYIVETGVIWLFDIPKIIATKIEFKPDEKTGKELSKPMHIIVMTIAYVFLSSMQIFFIFQLGHDGLFDNEEYIAKELIWMVVASAAYQLYRTIYYFYNSNYRYSDPDSFKKYSFFRVGVLLMVVPLSLMAVNVLKPYSIIVTEISILLVFASIRSILSIGLRNSEKSNQKEK